MHVKSRRTPKSQKSTARTRRFAGKYRDTDGVNQIISQKSPEEYARLRKASLAFGVFLALMLVLFVLSSFVSILSDLMLPLLGILLLAGGFVASGIAGIPLRRRMKIIGNAAAGIAPGIVLILLAMSVKFIISNGGIMDTILYHTANAIRTTSPFVAILLIYALILLLELFVGSSSAKAFLVMPLIAPLSDLVGITRQTSVLAFGFGGRFFQHDLSDKSGAADLPWPHGGVLHQVDEVDDQAAAHFPRARLRVRAHRRRDAIRAVLKAIGLIDNVVKPLYRGCASALFASLTARPQRKEALLCKVPKPPHMSLVSTLRRIL